MNYKVAVVAQLFVLLNAKNTMGTTQQIQQQALGTLHKR